MADLSFDDDGKAYTSVTFDEAAVQGEPYSGTVTCHEGWAGLTMTSIDDVALYECDATVSRNGVTFTMRSFSVTHDSSGLFAYRDHFDAEVSASGTMDVATDTSVTYCVRYYRHSSRSFADGWYYIYLTVTLGCVGGEGDAEVVITGASTMPKGGTVQLTATVHPAAESVTWSVSNAQVLSMDGGEAGSTTTSDARTVSVNTFTGLQAGTCIVTVRAEVEDDDDSKS